MNANGLVEDMPLDVYLADPVEGGSLSHSGAKTLVMRTPAAFQYEREHGRPGKRIFDFGHAAHQMVLGVGPEIVAVDADDWRSKAAREERDDVRASGGVPILADEFATVTAMADKIREHPTASKLLAPGSGIPEVSAFARDPESGVWLRCRFDWVRHTDPTGTRVCVDYKTTTDASDEGFIQHVARYGYHIQDAFYTHVARLLDLADDVEFLFVAQEKTPPYQVNVFQLDLIAQHVGNAQMRAAIDLYKQCTETGVWPSYNPEVSFVSLPAWYQHETEMDLVR